MGCYAVFADIENHCSLFSKLRIQFAECAGLFRAPGRHILRIEVQDHPETVRKYGNDNRKITADYYVDDRSLPPA